MTSDPDEEQNDREHHDIFGILCRRGDGLWYATMVEAIGLARGRIVETTTIEEGEDGASGHGIFRHSTHLPSPR